MNSLLFSKMQSQLVFFQEFLKHPREIGAIIPSSRFLEKRILKAAMLDSAQTIIELGSGTGDTTKAILRNMSQQARLLSIEINPHFHSMVSRINDARLITHLGSANGIKNIMSQYGLQAPDVVISGIPFSTIGDEEGSKIIAEIKSILAPHGRFVAYQFRSRVASLGRPILGSSQVSMELLNIPPMRVYAWEKNSG